MYDKLNNNIYTFLHIYHYTSIFYTAYLPFRSDTSSDTTSFYIT
jgi:hypothetical protein